MQPYREIAKPDALIISSRAILQKEVMMKTKKSAIFEAKHLRSLNVSINLKLRDYVVYELTTLRANVQEKIFKCFCFPISLKFPPNLIIVWQND